MSRELWAISNESQQSVNNKNAEVVFLFINPKIVYAKLTKAIILHLYYSKSDNSNRYIMTHKWI